LAANLLRSWVQALSHVGKGLKYFFQSYPEPRHYKVNPWEIPLRIFHSIQRFYLILGSICEPTPNNSPTAIREPFKCRELHKNNKHSHYVSNVINLNHKHKHSIITSIVLHRAWKYLSITVDHQPTDCGCSPLHPTIGSEESILSTLATLVPSHDITRELSQFLWDSFSVSASAQVLFSANSQRSLSRSWPRQVLSDAPSTSSSRPSVHHPLERSTRSPLCLYFFLARTHLLLGRLPFLSCSFCQKETRVSLGLRDSVVLQADSLLSPQPDHASIHGGG
jgi:hypothetical protein